MIWFTILVISFVFVIAVNEADIKADKLATEIRFLQADMRIQEKVIDSLQSSLHTLIKINADKIINGSKMEHMESHD